MIMFTAKRSLGAKLGSDQLLLEYTWPAADLTEEDTKYVDATPVLTIVSVMLVGVLIWIPRIMSLRRGHGPPQGSGEKPIRPVKKRKDAPPTITMIMTPMMRPCIRGLSLAKSSRKTRQDSEDNGRT